MLLERVWVSMCSDGKTEDAFALKGLQEETGTALLNGLGIL